MKTPNKTLLMIRAKDQAVDFVTELAVTTPVVFAPMVRIEPIEVTKPLPFVDGIIFTSSNAVRIYAMRTQSRSAKVFCVGSTTVRVAKERGFNVENSFPTAKDLAAFFQAHFKAKTNVLYPRAETVSFDVAGELSKAGHRVHEAILYRQTFQSLSGEGMRLIKSSSVIVPILSREAAIRFHDFLAFAKPHDLTIVCISAPVAAIFSDLSDVHVEIAEKSTRAALLSQIKASLSACKGN